MERNDFIKQWTDLDSEQIKVRKEKVEKLKAEGFSPYAHNISPTTTSDQLREQFDHLDKEDIGETDVYTICGRAMLVRSFGKASFIQIQDSAGKFQFYISKNDVSAEGFKQLKQCDYGDIVMGRGKVFKTNKGELSLNCLEFSIITKSTRPLPEKFHGLTDQELKYRMRYVDMIMNQESRETLKLRSQIVRYIREFFYKKDFLEVETPMMHSVAGGATAKPFDTHHNALDMPLFMRIAPELHLKRLIVGGFTKVFEMNRCFRNEGLSMKHNPEFTSIEFYQAYANYNDLMDLTEELLASLTKDLLHGEDVNWGENTISFKAPFKRQSMADAVLEHCDLTKDQLLDTATMESYLLSNSNDFKKDDLKGLSKEKLLVYLFETFVEDKLIQPTFITHFPTEVSPLSRRNDEDPSIVDRFELYINGWEIANAFNELNDPSDQLGRFADQAVLKSDGDDEACDPDYDYVRALEYGMPPTAGEGIGIDRLVMLLTNSHSIKDVILFPLLKQETFFEKKPTEQQEE